MDTLGWVGQKVQHKDGRSGQISREFIGFGFAGLTIRTTDGSEAYVQLNASGQDGGEAGWQWWCANFDGGSRWLTLGDHDVPTPTSAPGL